MMTKEDYLNEYKTHKSMRDNVKRDNYRLQYHLMPPTGFLNDPNGLFQKDGVYHINIHLLQLDGEQSFGDIIQAKI